uniref:Cytochrome b5 heme-binding domain-containing protein n=2 Tax=Clastoptera arizonana TaxID=38151 RepID=A0A1B6CDY8_9HEMI
MVLKVSSWPEWAYPEWRSKKVLSPYVWLDGKRTLDGADGLWRIHDKIYDLTEFISRHPGGSSWLNLTKGTDITEAFEVHHIGPLAKSLLPKFEVGLAKTNRNSPFTFHDDGFYNTLRKRIYKVLEHKKKHTVKSLLILDILVAFTIVLSLYSAYALNFVVAVIAGLFLCLTVNCSHNFIHQKNNWRMYYFNISLMTVRDWRVIHVFSHHLFANTIYDLEIGLLEPWLQLLPSPEKNWVVRKFSGLYSPVIYPVIFHFQALSRIAARSFCLEDLIGLVLPILLTIIGNFGGRNIVECLFIWTLIISSGSFFFGLIGVNAAHHHPDMFHDGDAPRLNRDWGLNQIDAVGDRTEFKHSLFVALTTYGHHTLHHLFPTVDHGHLAEIYPILEKTCQEFDCPLTIKSSWDLFMGQYQQLMRNEPNQTPHDKTDVKSSNKMISSN